MRCSEHRRIFRVMITTANDFVHDHPTSPRRLSFRPHCGHHPDDCTRKQSFVEHSGVARLVLSLEPPWNRICRGHRPPPPPGLRAGLLLITLYLPFQFTHWYQLTHDTQSLITWHVSVTWNLPLVLSRRQSHEVWASMGWSQNLLQRVEQVMAVPCLVPLQFNRLEPQQSICAFTPCISTAFNPGISTHSSGEWIKCQWHYHWALNATEQISRVTCLCQLMFSCELKSGGMRSKEPGQCDLWHDVTQPTGIDVWSKMGRYGMRDRSLCWTLDFREGCLAISGGHPENTLCLVISFRCDPYLGVSVLPCLGSRHLHNLAGPALDHHVPVFADGWSLNGDGLRSVSISTLERLMFVDFRTFRHFWFWSCKDEALTFIPEVNLFHFKHDLVLQTTQEPVDKVVWTKPQEPDQLTAPITYTRRFRSERPRIEGLGRSAKLTVELLKWT